DDCNKLLNYISATTDIEKNRKMRKAQKSIIQSIKKITIANEMQRKNVICVSGLQGAGKTTLIKNFYNLNDDVMNVSLERGEKLPIFISEKKDCLSPKMYGYAIEKNGKEYIRKRNELTNKQFLEESSEETMIYLEMEVPYTHFKNQSFSMMLLPGIEKKNNFWQQLVRFSLANSDASIFVCDEARLSRESNKLLLEDVQNKFGKNLIYVLSRSDTHSDENNLLLKESLIKELELPSYENNRVVCTGEYFDESKNEKWISELKNAIIEYCSQDANLLNNTKAVNYIREVIEEEIRPCIELIRMELEEDKGNLMFSELENSSYLNTFDRLVTRQRNDISRFLMEELDNSSVKCLERLKNLYGHLGKEKGLKETLGRRVKKKIFGENVKDIILTQDRIDEALKDENGKYRINSACFKAVDLVTKNIVANNDTKKILGISRINESIDENKTNLIFHDIKLLLDSNCYAMENFEYKNINETIKVLIEIASLYFGYATLNNFMNRLSNDELSKLSISSKVNFNEITGNISQVDKLFLSVVGLTGLDKMGDGEVDGVKTIAEGLGLPIEVVAAGTLIIGIFATATAISRDINKIQRAEYYASIDIIQSIHEKTKTNYLEKYDLAMDQIRERVQDSLIELSGVNSKYNKLTNAAISLNRIEMDIDTISVEVAKEYDIRVAFEG
ncbi:MAG: hypothetical protein U0L85_03470, partial [Bacilli bacterium]|nr:hypothetical protein [Bacilli bacterium]